VREPDHVVIGDDEAGRLRFIEGSELDRELPHCPQDRPLVPDMLQGYDESTAAGLRAEPHHSSREGLMDAGTNREGVWQADETLALIVRQR
jgi:hypothetical protein